MFVGISGEWANYWTERKLQNRLWGKMIRMPMRLYDKQDPSSLISRVTGDTMQVTYSLSYVFSLINTIYSLVLMLGMIWEMNSTITLSLLCVLPYIWLVGYIPGRFKFSAKKMVQEMAERSNMDVETMLEKFQISDAAAHNQVFFNKAEELLKERCEQLMEE